MKTFTNTERGYKEQILRNKLERKTKIFLKITCDYCSFQEEYECGDVIKMDESVDKCYENGWEELVTRDKTGIACPICMEKWRSGSPPGEYDENWK